MTTGDDALFLARAYLASRNNERAVEVLMSALRHLPNDPDLLTELARAQLRMDEPERAELSAQAALSVAPGHVQAMCVYALALAGLEERDAALQVAHRAVLAAPGESRTHHTYAFVLFRAWQYEPALRAITEAQRLEPDSADIHFQRGLILGKMRRWHESNAAYAEALRLEPGYASAVHNIAVNHLDSGGWRAALRGFLGAARMDPALGTVARRSVGAALRTPLRWTTLTSVVLCFVATVGGTTSDIDAGERLAFRLLAACGIVVLLTLLGWSARAAREIPGRARASVLKAQPMLVVRLVIAFGTLAVATPLTLGLRTPGLMIAAVVLLIAALLVAVAGWKGGD